jgi:iron complex outermembrane receptor protein
MGAEASLRWQLTQTVRAAVAVTRLEATYLDSFQTCAGVPCNDANPQNRRIAPAGNRIAGTNRGSGFAEVAWQPRDATEFAAEMRAQGSTPVNDLNSDFAGRFATLALRARQRYSLGQGKALELFARVDNVTDRAYAGSVIVNEGNSRFFEPAPRRNWLLGVTAKVEFQ